MSKILRPAEDDDNDTALFDRLQEHVLKNFPNPERIGCPSHRILEAFVEEPSKVTMEQLNELHIMQCAECTRELMELRLLRGERRLKPNSHGPNRPSRGLQHAMIAAAACVIFAAGIAIWGNHPSRFESTDKSEVVSFAVDLSTEAPSRGISDDDRSHPKIILPRNKLHLRLTLPYFSPGGQYTVVMAKAQTIQSTLVSSTGVAGSSGAHTEVQVILDLRQLPAGSYYLGTKAIEDCGPYFYPVTVD